MKLICKVLHYDCVSQFIEYIYIYIFYMSTSLALSHQGILKGEVSLYHWLVWNQLY